MRMKQCSTCPDPQPVAAFNRDRRNRDGLANQCRNCRNQDKAVYRAGRRAELSAKQRAYAAANRPAIAARDAAYRRANRRKIAARDRAYRLAHADRIRAQQAASYLANRARRLAAMKAYQRAHPQVFADTRRRRRARKRGAPVNDLTRAQWEAIKAHYGRRCVYCGKRPRRLEQDHLTPLSKGGSHTVANVVPACRSCNSTKGRGLPLRPIQPLLLCEDEGA